MRSFRRFTGYFSQSNPHKASIALAGSAAGIVGLTSLSQSNVAVDPLAGLSMPIHSVVRSMNGTNGNIKNNNELMNRLDAEKRAAEFVTKECTFHIHTPKAIESCLSLNLYR